MNKYIDAEKLIERLEEMKRAEYENCGGVNSKTGALQEVQELVASLQQEQPKLTQVPRIEQEIQKKGWMNYSLLISEIGLHRSNAIDRIKETKERAAEIKRNIAPHDLAILGKYLESVGAEIVLCCLQQYCMDFMFTQDEVKEIIQHEQPEVDLEKFTDKIKTFQERYKYPEIVSIKGAMAFMARMFYQYPNAARQWYDSLPKATMD